METPEKKPPGAARSKYVVASAGVVVAFAFAAALTSSPAPEPVLPPRPTPAARRAAPEPRRATPPVSKPAEAPKVPAAVPQPQRGPHEERDAEGRLLRRVTAAGRVWSYERDAQGRVVATDGPEGRVVRTLDADGRLVERTDALGQRVRYVHDHADRVVAFLAGAAEETQAWDQRGRLIAVQAGNEELRWTHHSDDPGDVTLEDVRAGVSLRYGGPRGRRTVEGPGGRTTWIEDADADANTVAIETPAGTFRLLRDDDGRLVAQVAPNGVETRIEQGEGRDAIAHAGSLGEVLRVERRLDARGLVVELARDGVAVRTLYDGQGRLIRAGTRAWAYGPDGDRVMESREGTSPLRLTHDARGRLLTRGAEGFDHDAAGRIVLRAGPDGATRYGWDVFGRLTSVELPDGRRVEYRYDPLGRVATRTVIAQDGKREVTRRVHEGPRLLFERGPSGTRQWVMGEGLDEPLAYRDDQGPWTFLHADALGTVLAYSDAQGRRIDTAAFSPWGELERAPAQPGRPLVFAGRLVDPETGLVHMRARWYDPTLGRFLSPDPIGLAGGDNAFAYVRGDPLGRVDPLGLQDEGPEWLEDEEPLELEHESPPAWLVKPLLPIREHLPEEDRERFDRLLVESWQALDPDTRAELATSLQAPRWMAELERKVADVRRGFLRDHPRLAFWVGAHEGLRRRLVQDGISAIKESGAIAFDVFVTANPIAATDRAIRGKDSFSVNYQPKSNLGQILKQGRGTEALGALYDEVVDTPSRLSNAVQRTAELALEGRGYEAGTHFGEEFLAEVSGWATAAVGGGPAALRAGSKTLGRMRKLAPQRKGARQGVGAPPPGNRPDSPAPPPQAPTPPPAPPSKGMTQALVPDAPPGAKPPTPEAGPRQSQSTARPEGPNPTKKKRERAKDRRKRLEEERRRERGGDDPEEEKSNRGQGMDREFDDAAEGLTHEQRRELHDAISGQGLSREEIRGARDAMFPDNPHPGGS